MTKEQAKHLSEVLKAYSEGKELEYLTMDNEWVPKRGSNFDANPFNYRIKPEPKYRPYKSAEEFLKAQKEHGPYIKISDDYYLPDMLLEKGICGAGEVETWDKVINKYKWQDGTPCGILENE